MNIIIFILKINVVKQTVRLACGDLFEQETIESIKKMARFKKYILNNYNNKFFCVWQRGNIGIQHKREIQYNIQVDSIKSVF